MKRYFNLVGVFCTIALAWATYAYAANVTLTPIVGPNETGENSLGAQQVTDFSRIKIGSCTATATGGEATETATCNGASGAITMSTNMTAVSGAKDKITVTNSKIQAGDFVQCTLDDTGAAAASSPLCAAVEVTANTAVFVLTNITATSPAATFKVYFLVMTQGNPN